MSLDIEKSCSFQILISLTTVAQPGYCHLKSEVAALNWCWFCHVLVWCSTLHRSINHRVSCVAASGLPALL